MKLLQRILNIRPTSIIPAPKQAADGADFYLLECWNQYADLPDELLPYVDKIKTKSEWESLGFLLEKNKYGQIRKFKFDNKYFSFIKVEGDQESEAQAIRYGKRLTQNPEYIALLVERGCSPEEFLHNANN